VHEVACWRCYGCCASRKSFHASTMRTTLWPVSNPRGYALVLDCAFALTLATESLETIAGSSEILCPQLMGSCLSACSARSPCMAGAAWGLFVEIDSTKGVVDLFFLPRISWAARLPLHRDDWCGVWPPRRSPHCALV